MKLNQFAIYQVNQQTEGKVLWHMPYQEAIYQKISVRVEYYCQMSIEKMLEGEKVTDIVKRMKKELEVSDVLVLNRDGEISCYYIDDNYQIEGKKGNWVASDSIIIDGKQFYQNGMYERSRESGTEANCYCCEIRKTDTKIFGSGDGKKVKVSK